MSSKWTERHSAYARLSAEKCSDRALLGEAAEKIQGDIDVFQMVRHLKIHLMVRFRFGEICSCCCLLALPGPAWVLLNYVLRTIVYTCVVCTSEILSRSIQVRRG